MSEALTDLRAQGKAILLMVGVSVLAVLGMILLENMRTPLTAAIAGNNSGGVNLTVRTTLNLFIAAFALVGTFASVTMLIIVVKAVISIVRNLKS